MNELENDSDKNPGALIPKDAERSVEVLEALGVSVSFLTPQKYISYLKDEVIKSKGKTWTDEPTIVFSCRVGEVRSRRAAIFAHEYNINVGIREESKKYLVRLYPLIGIASGDLGKLIKNGDIDNDTGMIKPEGYNNSVATLVVFVEDEDEMLDLELLTNAISVLSKEQGVSNVNLSIKVVIGREGDLGDLTDSLEKSLKKN